MKYVRGIVLLQEREYRDAEATHRIPPRGCVNRSMRQCVVLFEVTLKRSSLSLRESKSAAYMSFAASHAVKCSECSLHEVEEAHIYLEPREDLMACRFCLV